MFTQLMSCGKNGTHNSHTNIRNKYKIKKNNRKKFIRMSLKINDIYIKMKSTEK